MAMLSYSATIAALTGALADPHGWTDPHEQQKFVHTSGVCLSVVVHSLGEDEFQAEEYSTELYLLCADRRIDIDDRWNFFEYTDFSKIFFAKLGQSAHQSGLSLTEFQDMLFFYFTDAGRRKMEEIQRVASLYVLEVFPQATGTVDILPDGSFHCKSEQLPKDVSPFAHHPRIVQLLKNVPLYEILRRPFNVHWTYALTVEIGATAHARARILHARNSPLYMPDTAVS